jgi:hypothetical protein
MDNVIARILTMVVAALVLAATASGAVRGPAGAGADSRHLQLAPVEDVSFPFWCSWGYEWIERCYRDDTARLPIGGDTDKVWRAGLRFALDSVPVGAAVVRADLSLWFDGRCLGPRKTTRACEPRPYPIDAHAILSPDWSHEREVEIGEPVWQFVLPAEAGPQWLRWNVTDLVAAWVDTELPNHGVLLKLTDGAEDFDVGGPAAPSSSFPDPTLRPLLDVDYLAPE